ncbi:MAG: KUP/HAK/KT family potassium transporter, partial [Flavisolibacter sp.]
TKANHSGQVEKRIIHSIFGNNPKRADVYWLVHLDRTDEPYTMEYGVEEIVDDKVIRVDFRLGFRVQPRIGVMLRQVVTEMVNNKELDIVSRYPSLQLDEIQNFRFVILESFLSYDNEFAVNEGFILNTYFTLKHLSLSDQKAFGVDSNHTVVEMVPLVVAPVTSIKLKRAFYKIDSENSLPK